MALSGKKFRERNLLTVGAVSAAVLVILALLALNFQHLPVVSNTKTYRVDLASAEGLQKGDVVTIAGIRVGQVTGMKLFNQPGYGDVAQVSFNVTSGPPIGNNPKIDVKILNPVGVEYLEITPNGSGHPTSYIPVQRTSVPYTLVYDLNQLSVQTQQLQAYENGKGLQQLVKSLNVVTDTLGGTSTAQIKAALNGVSQFSAVLANRQSQLGNLITQADQLATLLNNHNAQLVDLIGQSNIVLQVLNARKNDLDTLLKTTTALTNQIDHIIVGDRSVLDPMLNNLQSVSQFLSRDSNQIGQAIPLLAAFSRYAANVLGSGPWADSVLPTAVIPDNLIAQCAQMAHIDALRGCR